MKPPTRFRLSPRQEKFWKAYALELRRLLDGEIGGRRALQDLVNKPCGAEIQREVTGSVIPPSA